jgi:hypothetical protein
VAELGGVLTEVALLAPRSGRLRFRLGFWRGRQMTIEDWVAIFHWKLGV